CSSVPLFSRSRVMLSSQMLWPRSWSACVAFIASPLFRVWLDLQGMQTRHHREECHVPDGSTPSSHHGAVRRAHRPACLPCSAIANFPRRTRERSFELLFPYLGRPAVALSPVQPSMTTLLL